jgi:hypothetical protein
MKDLALDRGLTFHPLCGILDDLVLHTTKP